MPDHSLAHGDYEGPTVEIWDRGTYEPLTEGSFAEALDAGHATFRLDGERLEGTWTLHRTDDGEKPQWLLIKRRLTAGAMKAVLTDERFSDPDWIFERKLDGIRCIAIRDGSSLRMLSRNDLSLNDRYPGVASALSGQARKRFAVDGEVVSVSGRFQDDGPRLYHVFDVLWLDGEDVRGLPLRERKAVVEGRFGLGGPAAARALPQRGGRGDVRRGVRQRLGGRDRQARGLGLHREALEATG